MMSIKETATIYSANFDDAGNKIAKENADSRYCICVLKNTQACMRISIQRLVFRVSVV